MSTTRDEEWREFYTQVGFRHGFRLGAKAACVAAAPHLSAEQNARLDAWLNETVSEWTRNYLGDDAPPEPPAL